jgi:phage I-like protein
MEFAYTDSAGRGHLPIGDAAHVRNALARFGQTFFESKSAAEKAWGKILRAAKKFNIKHQGAMPAPKIREASESHKTTAAASGSGAEGEHGVRASLRAAANVSVCAVLIAAAEGAAPEWIELVPGGTFKAVDGRGPFTNEHPDQVIAASLARMPEAGLVLDYDHSTDLAAPEGRPAPAAGWIKQFKVENGAIFGRIEWTKTGGELVQAKHYRYVSPVFQHDEKSGAVECILRAALTNNPALINLPAIMSAQQGVQAMAKKEDGDGKMKLSEVMAALEKACPDAEPDRLMKAAACLMADDAADGGDGDDDGGDDQHDDVVDNGNDAGMAADPYESETAEAMAARHSAESLACKSDGDRAAMAKKHAEQKAAFAKRTATAARMSADLSTRIAKHPKVVAMAAELNRLRLEKTTTAATAKVDKAIKEGRLAPAGRADALVLCMAAPESFDKMIAAQPRIVASGPDGHFVGQLGDAPENALTPTELMVAKISGITTEQMVAAKKERNAVAA